jgi:phage terminase Nu1 subunit (DNA packaging protein)
MSDKNRNTPTNVVQLNRRGLVTKQQLAERLDRSKRWIELRQREGLPVADTDRFGRKLYRVVDVERWLHELDAKPRSVPDRIMALEQEVATLRATIEGLQRRLTA